MYSFHLRISAASKQRGITHRRIKKQKQKTVPLHATSKRVLLLAKPEPETPRPTVIVTGLPSQWRLEMVCHHPDYLDIPTVDPIIESPGFQPSLDGEVAWRRACAAAAAEEAEAKVDDWGFSGRTSYISPPQSPAFDSTVGTVMRDDLLYHVRAAVEAPTVPVRVKKIVQLMDYMLDHPMMREFFEWAPSFQEVMRDKVLEFMWDPAGTVQLRTKCERVYDLFFY
jgi:hypothetical protein